MFKKKPTPNYLKPIIIILVALLALFIILLVINFANFLAANQFSNQNNLELIPYNLMTLVSSTAITVPQIYSDSPVKGNAKAPITIYEFSSFDCLYGQTMQATLNKILKKYPQQIKLVWKDLPIDEQNNNIMLAHQASRCAQEQDKFWQYHDLLWQSDGNFTLAKLQALADKLNLRRLDFDSCLKNQITKAVVEKDISEANDLLISGTPHFYINEQEIMGLATEEDFSKIIEQELKQ